MKYIYHFSIILITLFILNTCGIEDTTMYFQEPKNLSYDEATFTIYFDGYNQEEDDNMYLFVGYDVYYYFNSDSSSAIKAAVRLPQQSYAPRGAGHQDLFNYNGVPSSFQSYSANDLDIIYQDVTFPATEEMIDDVLEEGKSDNVRLCLDNSAIIDTGEINPEKQVSNDYIYMEELFPKFEQYKSQVEAGNWGGIDDFKGFLDLDYYNNYGYSPYQIIGTDNYYKMKIFVIAKGFNSNTERNKGNYIESLKSTVREISIRVAQSTENP